MVAKTVVDLVVACRALAARGCDTGIGGHVSARDPESDEFWINNFDCTLGEVTINDVVKLDHKGKNLTNDRVISQGWEFHAGIYKQRPDVNSIVHTHGFWVTALASLQRPLRMRHNLCTLFYEDQVMSPDDSFDSIARAIGLASTIIIPWHGAITVARSIGRAAALQATLEDMAKLDVTLDQSAARELPEAARLPLRKLIDEEACYLEKTWELMTREADRYAP